VASANNYGPDCSTVTDPPAIYESVLTVGRWSLAAMWRLTLAAGAGHRGWERTRQAGPDGARYGNSIQRTGRRLYVVLERDFDGQPTRGGSRGSPLVGRALAAGGHNGNSETIGAVGCRDSVHGLFQRGRSQQHLWIWKVKCAGGH